MFAIASQHKNFGIDTILIKIENNKIIIVDMITNYEFKELAPNLSITDDNLLCYPKENIVYKFTENQLKLSDKEITEDKTININDLPLNLLLNSYGKCSYRCRIGSYEMLFMTEYYLAGNVDYSSTCKLNILIVDVNKMAIVKCNSKNNCKYEYSGISNYYQGDAVFIALSISINGSPCHVYVLDIHGKFDEFYVWPKDIFKNNKTYSNYILVPYENLIMYCDTDNKLAIFDYVDNKLIVDGNKPKEIEYPYSFVKIKEVSNICDNYNYSITDDFYFRKKNADIEIETNDGVILAHKLFLISECDYFKTLLSGNYKETSRIKLDFGKEIVGIILKYIYKNVIHYKSINQLLEAYYLCDEICYDKLKKSIGSILFEKYQIDENIKSIKIYDEELLNDLPTSIKTIIFDKDFNKSVNGIIPDGIEKLIFGMKFNKKISNIPNSVKSLEFGFNWNMYLSDIPDHIEFVSFGMNYNNIIKEYPSKLIGIFCHKSYLCIVPDKIIVQLID